MTRDQILLLILAMFFSLAAGLVGSMALMKRMLLAGDVISHLALPGIGLALVFKQNPIFGGALTLFLGTLLVWRLQEKTGLTTESSIGVVFAAALAIGAAVTPSEDLAESLFGQSTGISVIGFALGASAVLLVMFSILSLRDQLSLSIISPDLAATTNVNLPRLNLIFLSLFSLTVLVGLRFMGALLASGLIIMPAATARQLTSKLKYFLVLSASLGLLSVTGGFLLNAFWLKVSTAGPIIAILSAALFAVSLLARKAR